MAIAASHHVVTQTFGQRLRLCRHLQGLRIKEFAIQLDVTPQYISVLEAQNTRLPSVSLLRKMAEVLHVSTGQLLGDIPIQFDVSSREERNNATFSARNSTTI